MAGGPIQRFVVDGAGAGRLVDAWLAAQLPGVSRQSMRRRVRAGDVRINGAIVQEPSRRLNLGDVVELNSSQVAMQPALDLPENISIHIVYECEHLLIVDKPAGLVVHPATGHARGTLVNALLHHRPGSFSIGGRAQPGIVHRLDRFTSGLLLVAKDDATLLALQSALERREIVRSYLVLVEGAPPDAGTFDTPFGRDRRDGKRYTSIAERIAGPIQHAVTHFQTIERFHGAALVHARLETGRTHQIRVHFRDHDHPVLGDPIYGRRARVPFVRGVAARLARPALHATSVSFTHPATRNRITIDSHPPPDLQRAIESLRSCL